jgi:hypothetical protein
MDSHLKKKKKRHLNYLKCSYCRRDKKKVKMFRGWASELRLTNYPKCEPTNRVWPQKCRRCIDQKLACSENLRAGGFRPDDRGNVIVDGTADTRPLHPM